MSLYSLPNKLTSLRLGLAFVFFICIDRQWWLSGLLVFAVAAFTDWLDGYYARKRNLISALGRVYDPLVDKVLVCGAFVFLSHARNTGLAGDAGLNAWMVVIIIAREFIVTGIRGFLEDKGVAFGADQLGKLKMVLQCAAILWVLTALAYASRFESEFETWLGRIRDLLNWAAVAVTFLSGANYVRKALKHLG